MANNENEKKRHFILEGQAGAEPYRSPSIVGAPTQVPARDRAQHGRHLQDRIQHLKATADQARGLQENAGLERDFGLLIEFESFPDVALAFERLDRPGAGIELLNVRQEGDVTYATVFVPDGKLTELERLVTDYLDGKADRNGRPRDNRVLIDTIREIRAASVRALWTDDDDVFPQRDEEEAWWEVWLPVRGHREGSVARFMELATACGVAIAPGQVSFPERTVLLARATPARMQASVLTLNQIAELRQPKVTADFFDSMAVDEQADWIHETLTRLEYPDPGAPVPHVCILDTGTNRGHRLLESAIATEDLHTVDPEWGVADQDGHGTAMAGLAVLGDLTPVLEGSQPVLPRHRLESVKLLEGGGANGDDPVHHGYLTEQAVYRPEITAPERQRVFGMMITARENRDRGRPSAWSATLDRLASDAGEQGLNMRLFVVAAGNINDVNAWSDYPESNTTDAVHDPAQAWNALTVGACTNLTRIEEGPEYEPVAPAGGLSPFSTTSATWNAPRPLKPDVVFEGGNAAQDALGGTALPSLSLLTANHKPAERLLTTSNATSAATALGARMAADLQASYPDLWPEAIRALIVQSASWTDAMRAAFLPDTRQPTKRHYASLVRHCGFGVPDEALALWSAENSLTLIAQDYIQPFEKGRGGEPSFREMRLHRLPWPLDSLRDLGGTEVEMRVTLSYFIEPNPSARGSGARYRYESHGLRFDVKRPLEDDDQFRARINVQARDESAGDNAGGNDPNWLLGTQGRHLGSLHSDIWRGSAADLAERGTLAVYPVTGWWKTRKKLERFHNRARYALVVSIRAPEVDVDLYTPVENQISTAVAIET